MVHVTVSIGWKTCSKKGAAGRAHPKSDCNKDGTKNTSHPEHSANIPKRTEGKRNIIIKNQAYHWECMKLWLVFMPKCEMEFFKTNHLLKLEETQEKWKTTCETMPKNTTKFPIKIAKVNAILLLVFSLSFFVCERDDLKAHIHTHTIRRMEMKFSGSVVCCVAKNIVSIRCK